MSKKRIPHSIPISPTQQALLSQLPNISLVGLMGSGKSTVGRLLAATLNRPFFDSDEEIIHRTGASIPTIFEFEGEAGFREREAKMIQELSEKKQVIIATGGGAVLREDNRTALKKNSWVIYLSTTPEKLLVRTRFDRNRPLLQNPDPLGTLKKMHEIRHPLYSQVADIIVTTGSGQVVQVATHILEALTQKIAQAQGQPDTH
ncbi:shikimate kinase [Hydromonas duriensis]|uniref:Shikimate kinase n=1 Tax=Hydromonas duriensis TaxID=1527608 RepID=A0A4R6YBJ8_9BURK|nr:shikimate kinase [Hydromonas duriensis]TDR33012.1 shikimate kinase [Hydromonas duriensis]